MILELLIAGAIRPTIPGATNPVVTQLSIRSTICVSGWTSTVRPPSSYTTNLKIQQLKSLHYTDQSTYHYEEDHFIPLELGGSPKSPQNLWPEPYPQARITDKQENSLRAMVCAGFITLAKAQQAIIKFKQQNG